MNTRALIFLAGWLQVVARTSYAAETHNPVFASHIKDLVVLHGEQLVPLKSDPFAGAQYTVLYFGAGWCPDCRRFSPALVNSYTRQSKDPKRFEVLLFPMDKSEADLLKFMRTEKMQWPAISISKLDSASELKKYAGRGIPWLSVFDRKGNLVLQSKSDQDAAEVLKQLEELVKKDA